MQEEKGTKEMIILIIVCTLLGFFAAISSFQHLYINDLHTEIRIKDEYITFSDKVWDDLLRYVEKKKQEKDSSTTEEKNEKKCSTTERK